MEGWKRVGEAWDGRAERSLAFPGRENERDPWLDLLFVRPYAIHCSFAYLSRIFTDICVFMTRSVHPIPASYSSVCFSRLP